LPSVDSTIHLIQISEQQGFPEATTTCSSALADAPWNFDATPSYGPGASMADHLPANFAAAAP
jgi:quinolinate synthase